MDWYWIVLITIGVMEFITIIIALFDEDTALMFSYGIVYYLYVVLTYPIRALRHYNRFHVVFQKHNITRLQYLLGKRIDRK